MRRLAAAFVVFHVLAVVVLSVPRPPPGLRAAGGQKHRHTEEMLGEWADVAQGLGIDRAWAIRVAHTWVPAWNRLLSAVRRPFEPYASLTGARQSWLMFGSVPKSAARLEIDVRVDGAWVPLYRPQSGTYDWNARILRQERMRAEIHRYTARSHRVGFEALADRLVAGFGPPIPVGRSPRPRGDRIRFQMRKVTVPDPDRLAELGALRTGGAYWTEERDL